MPRDYVKDIKIAGVVWLVVVGVLVYSLFSGVGKSREEKTGV